MMLISWPCFEGLTEKKKSAIIDLHSPNSPQTPKGCCIIEHPGLILWLFSVVTIYNSDNINWFLPEQSKERTHRIQFCGVIVNSYKGN